MIFGEILIYAEDVSLDGTCVFRAHERTFYPGPSHLGIMRRNEQAHQEATAILYGANRFRVDDDSHFAHFLDQIGLLNAKLLRHLSIPFPDFLECDTHIAFRGIRALDLIKEKCHGLPNWRYHRTVSST